nr:hypothetical protein CFP56_03004 [Quercus suber]
MAVHVAAVNWAAVRERKTRDPKDKNKAVQHQAPPDAQTRTGECQSACTAGMSVNARSTCSAGMSVNATAHAQQAC